MLSMYGNIWHCACYLNIQSSHEFKYVLILLFISIFHFARSSCRYQQQLGLLALLAFTKELVPNHVAILLNCEKRIFTI
jgi:hypothetical protein